jgi:hypothetical protein
MIRLNSPVKKTVDVFSIWIMPVLIIVTLFSGAIVLSGCLDQKPDTADTHLISFSSDQLYESLKKAQDWVYAQSEQNNTSFFIRSTGQEIYLKEYEQMLLYTLIAELSLTNVSFLPLHEAQMTEILSMYPDLNDSSSLSNTDLLTLSMILDILFKSPYAESYMIGITSIQKQLIQRYPTLIHSQSFEDEIQYHSTLSHIGTSLLYHAYRTGNITSYHHALMILRNDTTTAIGASQNAIGLLCSSMYTKPYCMVPLLFDDHSVDENVFSIVHQLISMQEKDGTSLGAFSSLTSILSDLPESYVETGFYNAIADAYELSLANDTYKSDEVLPSLILAGYRTIQNQISSDSDPLYDGGFPMSNGSDGPSVLSTVESTFFLRKLEILLSDQQPYIYVYNENTDELFDSHPYDVTVTDSIWPALILGTIFSILLIAGVFLIIRLKKWQ